MIPPLPQIEIIHCLQEQDMADEKKPKKDTTPVERCPVEKPDAEARPSSGGGNTGEAPPKPK